MNKVNEIEIESTIQQIRLFDKNMSMIIVLNELAKINKASFKLTASSIEDSWIFIG